MHKINFSERVMSAFEKNNCTYDGYKASLLALANREIMFDAEGNKLSDGEANDVIRKVQFDILGIDYKNVTKRDRKRALRDHGRELFDVIEEVIDIAVEKGQRESEFFNNFVENRNLSLGDRNEFWTDEEVTLVVSRVSGDHHDLSLQRLGAGSAYSVATSTYGIATGGDINLFLMGRKSWADYVDAVAKAFVVKVQNEVYAQVMKETHGVPKVFQKTLDFKNAAGKDYTAIKETLDQLINDISTANGNCGVIIMGTNVALKNLTKLTDVTWADEGTKKDVTTTGRLGSYEGTQMVELPQRFDPKETFNGETLSRLVDTNKMLILPNIDDKFVKFVDVGETSIDEVTEKGEANGFMDDMQKYEVKREFGITTRLGRYHGIVTIA